MTDRAVLRQTLRAVTKLFARDVVAAALPTASAPSSAAAAAVDADAATLRAASAHVAAVTAETLAIALPPVGARGDVNIWCADVYADADVCASVFGMLRAGGRIPLHDHARSYGFIRVLRGRVRIRSYSWLPADEERALVNAARSLPLNTWPLRYEGEGRTWSVARARLGDVCQRSASACPIAGERTFDASGVGRASAVAALSPCAGNVHEVEALDDGTAFFDLLVPGYANASDCRYFEECGHAPHAGGDGRAPPGHISWLSQQSMPSNYRTALLHYDTLY